MSGPDALAARVIEACKQAGWMVATAESCTGGLICGALTDIPGSSTAVDRGFVTYSNAAKTDMLGVAPDLIGRHGAVSSEVAAAMAEGALSWSQASIAVSVTGIAGPDGGSAEKPVGLVWFGLAIAGHTPETKRLVFPGDRTAVRSQAVTEALNLLLKELAGRA